MIEISENKNELYVFLDIFLLSLAVYLLTASGVDYSDVGRARINVLSSITNIFDLTVPNGTGIKGIDGRDYSWFGIGSVIITLPLYLLGIFLSSDPVALVSLINQLVGAAINGLVFLFSQSLGNSKRTSTILALIYGFTTSAWYLAKDPGDHNIETLFLLLAIYYMHRHTVKDKLSYLLCSAISIGFCILTRPNAVVAIPALLVLLILDQYKYKTISNNNMALLKKLCWFAVALLPFASLFMWYNFYRFGSVFESGHHIMATQTGLDYFTGTDIFTGLSGLLFSPGKGFFYYSPVAVLFLFSIRSFAKSSTKIALCFVMIICSYFIFYAKNIYWHGDWAWGPRYVLATLPYFVIPVGSLINSSSKVYKLIILTICILGMAIQLLAISIHPHRYFMHLQLHENVIFTVAKGTGVQSIIEPPPNTYFDWHKSPILYQLKFLTESYKNISNYKYPEDIIKKTGRSLSTEPFMKVYDYWWLYSYFIKNSYKPFVVASMLLLVIMCCSRNLYFHALRNY